MESSQRKFIKLILIAVVSLLTFVNTYSQVSEQESYKNVRTVGSDNFIEPVNITETDGLILWALPTNGGTSANTRAPGNTWNYQRTEYLITAAEMSASGFPSSANINSIGFYINTAGVGTLTGTLNVYLRNTTDVTYSLGSSWTTTGFTQVSTNASFQVTISPSGGIYDIPFTSGSAFTYTGDGVYVAWEFSAPGATVGTTAVVHNCNTALTAGLYGARSLTAMPTTLASSNWRPATRFGTSDYDDIIDVTNIYTLERVPTPFGTPTPVGVRVSNVSTSAVTFDLTITVRDVATSTVRYTSTQTVTNLAGNTSSTINFAGWTPTVQEDVNITATTSAIAGETWPLNNTRTQISNVNNNLYSYNYYTNNPGGYGYIAPGEGIFASKYNMNGTGLITGVNVVIYNYAANVGNTVYGVVINSAGTIVAQSDNYIIQAGDLGTNKNFVFSTPAVFTNEIFYAGFAQTSSATQYYPLGTFSETPPRGNTFYSFAITGGTPAANSASLKFGIEAQVAPVSGEIIDAGTVSVDVLSGLIPGSVVPKATVKNFGTNPKSFNVNMTITGGYSSTKTVTNLAPGASQQVTFDNWNATLGQFTITVCTQLTGDSNPSNDCLSKDVGVYSGSWTSGNVYPTTTYLGGGVGINGIIYSIAGNTASALGTECYKYNTSADTWSPIASLPSGRRVLAVAGSDNNVFAIGGSNMSGVYQSTVYKYDITFDTWSTAAPLSLPTGWGKAVVYNNKIYFAGGVDTLGNVLSTVYVYDITSNTWAAATSMPGPKFGGGFSVIGNKLVYVAGANATVINSDVYVGTIDAGNPTLIVWTTMNNPYPGTNGAVVKVNLEKLTELEVSSDFNTPSNDASAYPPGTMYRFDAAPWGTDGIIVANGSPSSAWTPADPNPTYIYKPSTDTWTKQADVPVPVLGASLGTVNSGNTWKLVVASGLASTGLSNTTQIWTDILSGVPTTFQLTVNISNGWNMVSVPGTNPDGMGVNTWWAYRDMGANVFKYLGGYQSVTTTSTGIGYWMKHTGARTYNTGDEWPAVGIQIVTHSPISAASGWNLFGGYETSVATSGLTTIPSGLISGSVYKYSGGYAVATTLDPGYGYWVKLTGAGQIVIPSAIEKDSGELSEYTKEDWGRIILTDATGVSYTLYAVQGKVDLNQYELPPAPPEGMFDIRYGSGRIAENLNSGSQTIEMSGVSYPITVSVENMAITLQDVSGKGINSNLKPGESLVIDNNSVNKLVVLSGELANPTEYALEQNYPNPFNPTTTIKFAIPEATNVRLVIYNALGQKVAELVNSKLETGRYSYRWDASNAASGMYIYELRTDNFISVKKMVLLK